MSDPTIEEVKSRLARELLQDPRVSGVGIEGDHIKVYLATDDPDLTESLPSNVEGFAVETEVLGAIRPLSDNSTNGS